MQCCETEANLEELAGSVPNALYHMLAEPGRRVVLHAAGWGLLAAEGAVQEQPCAACRFYCHLPPHGVQKEIYDLLGETLRRSIETLSQIFISRKK